MTTPRHEIQYKNLYNSLLEIGVDPHRNKKNLLKNTLHEYGWHNDIPLTINASFLDVRVLRCVHHTQVFHIGFTQLLVSNLSGVLVTQAKRILNDVTKPLLELRVAPRLHAGPVDPRVCVQFGKVVITAPQ